MMLGLHLEQIVEIALLLLIWHQIRRPLRVAAPPTPADAPLLGRVEQPPAMPPARTLLLFSRGGALNYEVTAHLADAPAQFTYAHITYTRMLRDSEGQDHYQEV